ncbi:hypothetical protein LY76DRAFT_670636 [Colletotrichum caudatum]|nr:hypothetical protein LY76DRAFT_670636 [Colletotrichum caudatum]
MYQVIVTLAGLTGLVLGHSRVLNFVVDGASLEGFNPQSATPKVLAAWGTSVKNDGWVGKESYGKADIVCHINATWTVQIPPKVAQGHYVLRHEIIALDFARYSGQGAQHYPQCINIEVVSGRDDNKPSGILGTDLYLPAEEGLVYDISQSPTGTYNIPGPTVYAGATAFVSQTVIAVESSATAISGGAMPTGT